MPKARILYYSLSDDMRRQDKLNWFRNNKLESIPFTHLQPDEKHNWINMADNDFETLLPIADKEVKAGKKKEAIFEFFTLGVVTNRDEWVYDFDKTRLEKKVKFFIEKYNDYVDRQIPIDDNSNDIKWTRAVKNDFHKSKKYTFKGRSSDLSPYK